MKKGMLIILIVTIFTIGSSYRFIQLNKNIYLKLRLERQHFTKPAGKKEYGVLFKQMSPVLCVYWSCPGSPPELLYMLIVCVERSTQSDRDIFFSRKLT